MFDPMTAAEVTAAIGATARDVARGEEPLGQFARGQLMSAYSASRHLAVELSSFGPELERFSAAAADSVRTAAEQAPDGELLRRLAGRLQDASDPRLLGGAVCELLDVLRTTRSPTVGLRGEVHVLLRELCDREVELLADAIERRPEP